MVEFLLEAISNYKCFQSLREVVKWFVEMAVESKEAEG